MKAGTAPSAGVLGMKHVRPISRQKTVAWSAPINQVPKIAASPLSPPEDTDGPLLHAELDRLRRENEELVTELVLTILTSDDEVRG